MYDTYAKMQADFESVKVCECSTMVYKWADENPEKRKDKVVTNDIEKSNRDEGNFSINHSNRPSSS